MTNSIFTTKTAKKHGFNRKKRKDLIFYCCLLFLPILQFCVFYIGVNANSLLLAFKDYSDGPAKFVGFDNFERLFYDFKNLPMFEYALQNSFTAYFAGLIFGMSIGLIFSYYIYKKMWGASFFKVVLFAPSIISSMITVILYSYFVNEYIPVVVKDLFDEKIYGLLTNKDTRFATVLFFNIWMGFGGSILMYQGAMHNISESVIEAAQIDGVGPIGEFIRIVLPQIFSTVSVFLLTGLAGIFTNQMQLFAFFGANNEPRFYTIGYYLYYKVQTAMSYAEYPYLSALGLIITACTIPVVLFFRWLFNRIDPMND